jgi:hypothetical protein
MSLAGSLEDLGLGDILQIISLSRKSGVLAIRSGPGEGQIVFRDGRVVGAFCKGGPTDLAGMLVAAGALAERDFAAAARAARDAGTDVVSELAERGLVDAARVDELRRAQIERAAFTMFAWPTGEFSFEVCDGLDGVDPALCVEPGLDVQYLAMEGARLRDEESRDPVTRADPLDPTSFADLGEELRSDELEIRGEPAEEVELELIAEPVHDDGEAVAALAEPLAWDDDADAAPWPELEAVAEPAPPSTAAETAERIALAVAERLAEAPALAAPPAAGAVAVGQRPPPPAAATAGVRSTTPVVVLDPELAVLEWVKASLRDAFERVHIFQKTELAIARIRQYLVHRKAPLVAISDRAPPDPVSGVGDSSAIVARLKAQAPRMRVLLLAEAGAPAGEADGVLARPPEAELHDPRRAAALRQRGEALRRAVVQHGADAAERRPARAEPPPLGRLKQVSAELREAVPRGEIIPVVLHFAAEHFARVALFLVRDDLAVGMAQLGLPRCGGPDDAALRDLAIPADEPAWFREVFARRASVRGPVRDAGDRALARLLGDRLPPEAYVAPLESGDRVVALLYADNLPGGEPLRDAEALEVILHEAGLALDRAALERQLAEFEAD